MSTSLQIPVTLIRITSNHDRLRDSEIEGYCYDLPKVGQAFDLYGKARDIDYGFRNVTTSPVLKVEDVDSDPKHILFHTANSTYELKVG